METDEDSLCRCRSQVQISPGPIPGQIPGLGWRGLILSCRYRWPAVPPPVPGLAIPRVQVHQDLVPGIAARILYNATRGFTGIVATSFW